MPPGTGSVEGGRGTVVIFYTIVSVRNVWKKIRRNSNDLMVNFKLQPGLFRKPARQFTRKGRPERWQFLHTRTTHAALDSFRFGIVIILNGLSEFLCCGTRLAEMPTIGSYRSR